MSSTMDLEFGATLRNALHEHARLEPRRTRRQRRLLVASATTALTFATGTIAVAALLPAGERAEAPLGSPFFISGVGPQSVVVPTAPESAAYVVFELTCFDSTVCKHQAGGVEGPEVGFGSTGGAVPLGDYQDPISVQDTEPLDPTSGIVVDVDPGSHWRIYGVFTSGIDPLTAVTEEGVELGILGLEPTDLVPVITTTGSIGWVRFSEITYEADVTFTDKGVTQEPVVAYGADGVTPVGYADVSGQP